MSAPDFFKIKHLKIQTNLSRMFFCEKTTKTRMNAVAIRSNDVQREQRKKLNPFKK